MYILAITKSITTTLRSSLTFEKKNQQVKTMLYIYIGESNMLLSQHRLYIAAVLKILQTYRHYTVPQLFFHASNSNNIRFYDL